MYSPRQGSSNKLIIVGIVVFLLILMIIGIVIYYMNNDNAVNDNAVTKLLKVKKEWVLNEDTFKFDIENSIVTWDRGSGPMTAKAVIKKLNSNTITLSDFTQNGEPATSRYFAEKWTLTKVSDSEIKLNLAGKTVTLTPA